MGTVIGSLGWSCISNWICGREISLFHYCLYGYSYLCKILDGSYYFFQCRLQQLLPRASLIVHGLIYLLVPISYSLFFHTVYLVIQICLREIYSCSISL